MPFYDKITKALLEEENENAVFTPVELDEYIQELHRLNPHTTLFFDETYQIWNGSVDYSNKAFYHKHTKEVFINPTVYAQVDSDNYTLTPPRWFDRFNYETDQWEYKKNLMIKEILNQFDSKFQKQFTSSDMITTLSEIMSYIINGTNISEKLSDDSKLLIWYSEARESLEKGLNELVIDDHIDKNAQQLLDQRVVELRSFKRN